MEIYFITTTYLYQTYFKITSYKSMDGYDGAEFWTLKYILKVAFCDVLYGQLYAKLSVIVSLVFYFQPCNEQMNR